MSLQPDTVAARAYNALDDLFVELREQAVAYGEMEDPLLWAQHYLAAAQALRAAQVNLLAVIAHERQFPDG